MTMTATGSVTSGADVGTGQDLRLRLRILATSDLHAHLFSYNYFADHPDGNVGLARLAAVALKARAECPNTLLFDNGDTFQGAPLGDAALSDLADDAQAHPMIVAMNGLGYDAATLGNHDFDYGIAALERIIAAARYPIVSANVIRADGGGPFVAPHVILERRMTDTTGAVRTARIGVTGALPPQTLQWGRAHLAGRIEIEPILPAVAREVARMRAAGVDLVVVLAHTGLGHAAAAPGDENVAIALAALEGVDAVVAGHTHRVFPMTGALDVPALPAARSAALVQPGFFGSHLAQIDFDLRPADPDDQRRSSFGSWCVASSCARLRTAQEADQMDRRALRGHLWRLQDVRGELARGHRRTRAFCDRPLGQSQVPLETFFSLLAPCAATQLIADAQRAAVAPIIAGDPALAALPLLSCTTPFKAGGRGGPDAYTNVSPGAILLRHAADLYPYSNGLAVLRATGAQIRDWLERAVSAFCQILPGASGPQILLDHGFASYNFDRLDGVSYQIDLSQPARTNAEGDVIHPGPGRIRDLRRACGREVVDDDVFLIVTNTYRAAGGGHYPVAARCDTVYSTVHPVRDVLANHIAARPDGVTHRPVTGFSFAPLGGANLVFETGPASIQHKARAHALGLVADGTSDQGFARYLLRL